MALLVEATKLELRKKKVRGRERGTRLVRFFFFTPDPPSPPPLAPSLLSLGRERLPIVAMLRGASNK